MLLTSIAHKTGRHTQVNEVFFTHTGREQHVRTDNLLTVQQDMRTGRQFHIQDFNSAISLQQADLGNYRCPLLILDEFTLQAVEIN
jgi:hypothetical protein